MSKNFIATESKLQHGKGLQSIKVWGSPTCVCRNELYGINYLSNGFEKNRKKRKRLWQNIPSCLDILITHIPPKNILCGLNVGDEILKESLKSKIHKPRFQVFGHDHYNFGVQQDTTTTYVNCAQKDILRNLKYPVPFIFDIKTIPLRRQLEVYI